MVRFRPSMNRLSLLVPALFVFVATAAACTSATTDVTPGASTNVVTLRGVTFEPATITIKVGETVTWKWESGTHDVKSGTTCSADGKFASGEPVAGAQFEQKFDTA